jgi:DNA-binding NarL/FixJ family response regulator
MRVALADHHYLAREAIKKVFESFARVKVVGECASGEEAIELVREITPDIFFNRNYYAGYRWPRSLA